MLARISFLVAGLSFLLVAPALALVQQTEALAQLTDTQVSQVLPSSQVGATASVQVPGGETTSANDIRAELLPSLKAFQQAFNAGKADDFAAHFLADGEFVDEQGAVHSGRAAIQELMTNYFKEFPGVQLAITVESLRQLGPDLLIEEGTREVFTPESEVAAAKVRYVAVRAKRDGKWMLATVREFADEPAPTPGEQLAQLEFLIGNWLNEGTDATLKIRFDWSADGNFLIGEFESISGGASQGTATQRFGWDPVNQQIRSWLFEPDGAYSEGLWSPIENGWLCKSTSVLPDGTTGSAILEVIVQDDDHFILKGRDRVIAGVPEPGYELNVARQIERPTAPNSQSDK